jgi:uncharacterized phage protein (TIGR01671 family)
MREIKYRAWHKAERHMGAVEVLNLEKGAFVNGVMPGKDQVTEDFTIVAPARGRFCFFEDIELMQYTGLKDKNGVDIYEGDILRHDDLVSYQEVLWIGARISIHSLPTDDDYEDLWMQESKDIEVIGNIYENPELLGEKS